MGEYERRNFPVETLAEQYRRLIEDRAISFHRSYGMPMDELRSEGYLILCSVKKRYNPQKARLCTYLYVCLNSGLTRFTSEWRRQLPADYVGLSGIENSLMYSCEQVPVDWVEQFWEAIRELSEEAEQVVVLVIDGPEELYEYIRDHSPKKVRGKLVKYLREECRWTWAQIWMVFREIKEFVRSL